MFTVDIHNIKCYISSAICNWGQSHILIDLKFDSESFSHCGWVVRTHSQRLLSRSSHSIQWRVNACMSLWFIDCQRHRPGRNTWEGCGGQTHISTKTNTCSSRAVNHRVSCAARRQSTSTLNAKIKAKPGALSSSFSRPSAHMRPASDNINSSLPPSVDCWDRFLRICSNGARERETSGLGGKNRLMEDLFHAHWSKNQGRREKKKNQTADKGAIFQKRAAITKTSKRRDQTKSHIFGHQSEKRSALTHFDFWLSASGLVGFCRLCRRFFCRHASSPRLSAA